MTPEVVAAGKCTQQLVRSAAMIAKCPFAPLETSQSTVANVLGKEVEAIIEDLIIETTTHLETQGRTTKVNLMQLTKNLILFLKP